MTCSDGQGSIEMGLGWIADDSVGVFRPYRTFSEELPAGLLPNCQLTVNLRGYEVKSAALESIIGSLVSDDLM